MSSDPSRLLPWLRAAFLLITVSVLVLALWPSPASLPVQTGWDKADHVLAFAVLGIVGLWAWPQAQVRVSVGLLGYGGFIEVLQGMTGYREADWHDFAADAIGIGVALLATRLLRRRAHRA